MKRDLTVYVASAWWRDSDPHTGVVALTAAAAEKTIEESIREAAERDVDGFEDQCPYCDEELTEESDVSEHLDCAMDAQAWSGIHPESLRYLLADYKGSPYRETQRQELLDALRASGVAYMDTP